MKICYQSEEIFNNLEIWNKYIKTVETYNSSDDDILKQIIELQDNNEYAKYIKPFIFNIDRTVNNEIHRNLWFYVCNTPSAHFILHKILYNPLDSLANVRNLIVFYLLLKQVKADLSIDYLRYYFKNDISNFNYIEWYVTAIFTYRLTDNFYN